ncbi:HAMP domain-containing sensor histidine kinase [Paraflavitalea speifideaquila]|uniref:sensor histidine kinase n=1 Tax=Paraflavitalea speifideaquila TaxID=3076558 RepID=UPI0028EB4ADB|nr:HAMP domain-containing sensor histidine kinase [Paraflavitalea speifideiaquila]
MNRNTRLVFFVCVAAVCGVIILQSIWIGNYYQVNQERFNQEVNLAFEDAIKTEFKRRCDTVEGNIYKTLMDTAQISITSRWSDKFKTYVYFVASKKDTSDKYSFSSRHINGPILATNDSIKQLVARKFAATYRTEDLEKRIIFFRTQSMGRIVTILVDLYKFDTLRLRPIYHQFLAEKGIEEPFIFYMRDEDSTLNRTRFPDSLLKQYPVITKSFPTWSTLKGDGYVRAMFQIPTHFLLGKMTGTLIASGVLLLIVALAFWYLLRVIRRVKKLSAIKNDFISNISHELKTPIATVAAAVEAMADFGALQNAQRTKRYLQISRTELQRLADMVNKILNIARYEQQDFELKPESIAIDELIEDLISKYPLPGDKHINFQYANQAGTNLPMADKQHLYNVLNNLIDNAVKYSGSSVTINIQCYREKHYYIISVKDDGIGIAASDLPYIFDKFYRVPSGNVHKVKGHGLGLNYVKHIMEKHGGWCQAESRPGKGSTFKLGLQV